MEGNTGMKLFKLLGLMFCFLGIHKWENTANLCSTIRVCSICGKVQILKYDPMYGSSDWEEL